jgi:ABC-2 type transport system permease protein
LARRWSTCAKSSAGTLTQELAHVNPLSYEVDALRALMLAGGTSVLGLGLDFIVLIAAVVIVIAIEAKLYPRVIQ